MIIELYIKKKSTLNLKGMIKEERTKNKTNKGM